MSVQCVVECSGICAIFFKLLRGILYANWLVCLLTFVVLVSVMMIDQGPIYYTLKYTLENTTLSTECSAQCYSKIYFIIQHTIRYTM